MPGCDETLYKRRKLVVNTDLPTPLTKRYPRYWPHEELPPYRYVPLGSHPHPTMDAGGHMQDRLAPPGDPPSELAWMTNRYWLYGIDLFNNWYFWEAAEVWSPLWVGLEKKAPAAVFVQTMMMVSGGILKAHCNEPKGVLSFWQKADERFTALKRSHKELWGIKISRVQKDFRRFFKPAWARGELPLITKKIPQLGLSDL
jgi:hypothetical protein